MKKLLIIAVFTLMTFSLSHAYSADKELHIYDQEAKIQASKNDIKAFVYQWFSYFDHQVELVTITPHLSDEIDMSFPDFPIRSMTDFTNWYQNVIDNIQWNTHDISELKVTKINALEWNVSFRVRWRAQTYDSKRYDFLTQQDWQLIAPKNGVIQFKRHRAVLVKNVD